MRHNISILAVSALTVRAFGASNSSSGLLSADPETLGNWADAYSKAKAFVSQLTNAQKVSIITAGDFTTNSSSASNISWTAYTSKDAFAGMNNQFFVSGFTETNAVAMTWDPEFVHEMGKASGDEFYGMGYTLIAGPEGGPLGRTPWGGRSAEAFSPDPYLTGILLGRAINGMQSAGVIAGGRHFLLNEQETNRTNGGYSANADDKTIHELYLWPFADAVREGMAAVMCAMNKSNDTLSCENDRLLNQLLKGELGFPGFVYPDVGGQQNAFLAANGGSDYGSSSLWSDTTIEAGIANGSLTQARLDDMAIRNVIPFYYVNLGNGELPTQAETTEYRDVRGNHSALIRKIGGASLALLKNSNSSGAGLPLNKPRTISLFGTHAGPAIAGPNMAFSVQGTDGPTYQGHLASGSGSAQLSLSYLITPYQSLMNRAIEDGSMIWWLMNDTYSSASSGGMAGGMAVGSAPSGTNTTGSGNSTDGGMGGGATTGGGIPAGVGQSGTSVSPSYTNYASNSEVCLVFLNSFSGEGADRTELSNADQDTMVLNVASNCNNTIAVVNTVGPRLMESWIDNENVTAVLYGGLLGQESGNAIADVLYGDVNPSGRLISTIAKNESDYPVSICYDADCDFTEGVYIDYRHFAKYNITPRYPFGYGLSYTTFEYGEVAVGSKDETVLKSAYPTGTPTLGGKSDLFAPLLTITTTLTNTGSVSGAEVAQLYVSYPAAANQPAKQLRGFQKVTLEAGEEKMVEFQVRRKDVSYWDVVAQDWAVTEGEYGFFVGANVEDMRGSVSVTV
ncbi:glycoside hydrolase family 3 protein [Lentithecium fluviatile CBS 122367]|uniref:beta-glucosidase n=1 Tax=Lentithecium fluviatile CBS 122367 TaxID=1168545 RepID=A0A6G1JAP9_9PLEO|nr:glycoside hydrolase family 3 protein [Lentithecium fluviatile CBS 122367]